jgi:hypothetical protein
VHTVFACRRSVGASAFRPFATALLTCACLLAVMSGADAKLASASGGAVHALVVGIDDYRRVNKLHGAVNDARDIDAALQRGGVEDRTLLLDAEASRERFLQSLEALHRKAARGDLVILTFAGHGMKAPERIANSKEDHSDELILFADFDPSAPNSLDRVFGWEIYEHLKRFHESGVPVLYLADSCYGGGMTKGTDARAGALSVRGFRAVSTPELAGAGKLYVNDLGGAELPMAPARNKKTAAHELASLTFLAAVNASVEAPEIDLGPDLGGVRGLASFALARALEGRASAKDARSGATTRGSLAHFVRATVRAHSGGRQTPVVEPDAEGDLEQEVFQVASAASAPVQTESKSPPPEACVAIKTSRGVEMMRGEDGSKSRHCQKAGALAANLVYDDKTGDVIDGEGVLVASKVERSELAAVKLRSEVLRDAVRTSTGRQLQSWLTPKETAFAPGERFKAHFSGVSSYWLTIVNVTGKGTIQFLYPSPEDDNYNTEPEKTLSLKANPPFGADALIVFATKERAGLLAEMLNPAGGSPSLNRLRDAFRLLAENDKVGFAFFLTVPEPVQ